jgi:hypothetical protein
MLLMWIGLWHILGLPRIMYYVETDIFWPDHGEVFGRSWRCPVTFTMWRLTLCGEAFGQPRSATVNLMMCAFTFLRGLQKILTV